ncbi:hypothetical protein ABT112_13720 [Streptomyces sp. NPDC002055]|uniref:hypothetical protein n=1 Tax=Streptomyces sp. NPDC002055 TaxID=3154534 RepID=UPI0033270FB2
MNSAPHLLPEDRPEFERVLGEALRTASERQDPAALGPPLSSEQLRTMALAAATAISACAATEYRHYVKVRDEQRAPAAVPEPRHGEDRGAVGLAAAMGEAAEASGAGLLAVVSVLAPVLAGIAAVIFLLLGFSLRALSTESSVAGPLIGAGWAFAALTAAGIVVAMAGLLLTALRNGASSVRATAEEDRATVVGEAREAWRRALLERGLLPFLREAQAGPAASSDGDGERTEPVSRTPHLGYSRPGFSSPAAEAGPEDSRPRFNSPGYTSPEYGGPEHPPE